MKRLLASAALAALLVGPVSAQDAGTVLATVNGTEITLGHLIAMQAQLPDQYRQLADDVLFSGMLEQLVQQEVIASVARESLSMRAEIGLQNEQRAYLASTLIEQIAAEEISEADLQAEYDAVYGSIEPVQEFNASHILVETEEEATALIVELEAGGDFAELAAIHSTGPSGPNGGQLGWFTAGMMVPTFEAAVFELEVGEVSAPVETQFGWHIVTLVDVRDLAAPLLEDVQGELIESLQRTRVDQRVIELTDAADVVRPEITIDVSAIRDVSLLDQ
ncbi:MAG: peptidyl-prolyl cis-trans isomerase C [Paracoccaceae bacterium]|jgi:peptidyl-prolyl cis-trans isomerase C